SPRSRMPPIRSPEMAISAATTPRSGRTTSPPHRIVVKELLTPGDLAMAFVRGSLHLYMSPGGCQQLTETGAASIVRHFRPFGERDHERIGGQTAAHHDR